MYACAVSPAHVFVCGCVGVWEGADRPRKSCANLLTMTSTVASPSQGTNMYVHMYVCVCVSTCEVCS